MSICGVSAALSAAHATGLLERVLGEPRAVDELARELSLDPRIATHVLDVLAAAGLILRRGDRYGIPEDAPGWMQAGGATLGSVQAHFSHTVEALRTGALLSWMEQREATYRSLVGDLGKLYDGVASYVATHVRPAGRILDVGCGSGVWSLAIGQRQPAAHVVGLDFPGVLDQFMARARQLGLTDRVELLPGDMFRVELPPAHFDLVVVANVLRLDSPARARQLLGRVSAALRPGGQLLIIDALASGSPEKELARATYALHLALRTQDGGVRSRAQIAEWLRQVGIDDLIEIDCGVQITAIGALLGDKKA